MQINFVDVQGSYKPLTEKEVEDFWPRLHSGDREPLPIDSSLLKAWQLFHNGDFLACAKAAADHKQGTSLQLKALTTYAYYLQDDPALKKDELLNAIDLAESKLATAQEDNSNLYYQLAYCLGRYGQLISVPKALSEGLAGRITAALDSCLAIEPQHADAYTSRGTFQAEIIGKLGKLAAKLTYGVSPEASIASYLKGIELAPYSITAKTEYADGLLLIYGHRRNREAVSLYNQAVANKPIDALEALDWYIAKLELESA